MALCQGLSHLQQVRTPGRPSQTLPQLARPRMRLDGRTLQARRAVHRVPPPSVMGLL